MTKEVNVFTCINNISYDKEHRPDLLQHYNPWVVNKAFSLYADTLLLANEMNLHNNINNKMQYDFLFATIRKRKRWSKWPKKINSNLITLIAESYNVNHSKALMISKVLTDAQIKELERRYNKGGRE